MAPNPIPFPLGAPVVNGTELTVDLALNSPTRVNRRIADLTLQNFIVTRIFAQGGTVTGGAVVYDQAVLNELYLDRDVQYIAPGGEYPIVTSSRQAPNVAKVEKIGGRFDITDEARDRNDIAYYNEQVTQLSNTIVRKANIAAVNKLEAAITALGGAGTYGGHSWSAYQPGGTSPTAPNASPGADLLRGQYLADVDELGVKYDLLITNPLDAMNLAVGYGDKYAAMLDAAGIREVFASNRVTAGTAYLVARGRVGEIRIEKALRTITYREEKTDRTWTQAGVRPVMYVTNPYSIKKITGIA